MIRLRRITILPAHSLKNYLLRRRVRGVCVPCQPSAKMCPPGGHLGLSMTWILRPVLEKEVGNRENANNTTYEHEREQHAEKYMHG